MKKNEEQVEVLSSFFKFNNLERPEMSINFN